MKDSYKNFAELEHSAAGSTNGLLSSIAPRMFLPKRIYEALPAAYIGLGALFIFGAVYIGIDYTPMVGYLAVGLSCVLSGITVSIMRHRERSNS